MTRLINFEDVVRAWEERRNATGFAGVRYRAVDTYRDWRRRVREVPRRVKWAHQRVVRGWDDRAVWGLDTHLTLVLGRQLVTMSEIAHGYPGPEYPYERWVADLKTHGDALLAYSTQFDHSLDEWETLYQPARAALLWVADNLPALWD